MTGVTGVIRGFKAAQDGPVGLPAFTACLAPSPKSVAVPASSCQPELLLGQRTAPRQKRRELSEARPRVRLTVRQRHSGVSFTSNGAETAVVGNGQLRFASPNVKARTFALKN